MVGAAFLVVRCPECGQLILAKPTRTRTCPHCGRRFPLSRAMVVGRASSALEATELIGDLKMRDKER